MSLTRKQYTSLLAELDNKIEQSEMQLNRLKEQRRVSQLFADLQEIESGQLLVLGQQDSLFSLVESSPTFFKIDTPIECEIQVTRRDGKLLIETSPFQRSLITESELLELTADATWEPSQENDETCRIKVLGRNISRVWTYAAETPIVSVANLAESSPQFSVSGPQISIMPQQTFAQPNVFSVSNQ